MLAVHMKKFKRFGYKEILIFFMLTSALLAKLTRFPNMIKLRSDLEKASDHLETQYFL